MSILLTLLALSASAQAEETEPSKLISHGELRLIGSQPPDFVVDALGTTVGQDFVLDSRLRAGLEWHPGDWVLALEGDAFSGQLAGDVWDLPGTVDARHRERMGVLGASSFVPRVAKISGLMGPVHLEAGLVSSNWGLGLVSNDGAHDGLFGRNDLGDRQIRLKLATQPLGSDGESLPVFIAIGVDRVVQDDMAELALDQEARQVLGSALLLTRAGGRVGVLGVARQQLEADLERFTRARILDLHIEQPFQINDMTLTMSGEVARITGVTSRSQSYNSRLGLWVGSIGAATEISLALPEDKVIAHLHAGYASGDPNPDDAFSQEFRFDRNYNVGMVLFEELMGAIEVASYDRITDPTISGQPPDGVEALVSEGALRGASYVQPVVQVRPTPWLDARLGIMAAWSTAPIREPFNSYRNGGVPTNHLGERTEGLQLGTELNWAVELGDPEAGMTPLRLSPQLLLQGGHLQASEDLGGEMLHLVMATGRVRW
jgi:hypothetical protein